MWESWSLLLSRLKFAGYGRMWRSSVFFNRFSKEWGGGGVDVVVLAFIAVSCDAVREVYHGAVLPGAVPAWSRARGLQRGI